MSNLWLRNIFSNFTDSNAPLPLNRNDLEFDGRPVTLCGAGPSLRQGIAKILEMGHPRPVIAAVDTAVPTLVDSGLVPDLVFLLEAQFWNMDDFICSSAFAQLEKCGCLLICDISSHPPSIRRFRRARAVVTKFADIGLLDALAKSYPAIPPLGSVGVTALYILLRYSDAAVDFCGFDFSFPPGKTHCNGSPAHQRIVRESNRMHPVSSWALQVPRHTCVIPEIAPVSNAAETVGVQVWLSDGILEEYARRFSEVGRLYGSSRMRALAHWGPPLDFQGSGKLSDGLPKTHTPQSPEMQSGNFRQTVKNDLVQIRRHIAAMLKQISPDGTDKAEPQQKKDLETFFSLLEKQDFLWKFLPSRKNPEYKREFLEELSRQLQFWIRYLSPRNH